MPCDIVKIVLCDITPSAIMDLTGWSPTLAHFQVTTHCGGGPVINVILYRLWGYGKIGGRRRVREGVI